MIDTKALRSRVLDLAIRGKLTEQFESDGTAEILYNDSDKNIDEDIPYDIPNNWKWVKLSNVGTTNIGLTYHPADVVNDGTIVIRSSNIVNGKMDYTDIVKVNCIIKDNQYVNTNDIVICARNGSKSLVGKNAIYEGESKTVAFGAFMAVFRTDYYAYVHLYFNTQTFRRYFSSDDSKQINQVTQAILKNSIIPLPPLAEQKRIVQRVEEIFKLLDTIDEAQEKYAEDAESLKAKLITAGIQGKLTEQLDSDGTTEELYQQIQEEKQKLIKEGKIKKEKPLPSISDEEIPFEIPGNWKWVRFGEISNIICTGLIRSGKEQYKDGEYYYFKMQNIGNFTGKCNFDDMVMINASQEEFEKTKLEEGDFLFNTRNSAELVGKAAVVHNMPMPKIILNNNILKIRFYGSIYPDFVNYVFISSEGRNLLYQFVSSTTNVAAIYQRQIVTLTVPLPPLAEQKRIADKLNELLETIN